MKKFRLLNRKKDLRQISGFAFCTACAAIALLANTGCKNIINRAQSPDGALTLSAVNDDSEKPETVYISNTCTAWGGQPTSIEGLSLATKLNGTGSTPSPGRLRENLIKELASRPSIDNAKKLVNDRDTEIVMVRGNLPPGIRKGERFDLQVQTLKSSEASSIEHGLILQARMRPQARIGRSVKTGHVKAIARGEIIVASAFSARDDQSTNLRGIIPGGGVASADREIGLSLRSDKSHPKTTSQIAHAINQRFTVTTSGGREGAAEPKTDKVINLTVPKDYQRNVGRFLQVIANMAYVETTQQRVNRLDQLDRELADPATSKIAALRLEAMGIDGHAALKRALQNPDLEVRFYAAQALAYQDQRDGIEVLKTAAKDESAFRWEALTALTSIEDSQAEDALLELLHVPSNETRYGAFFALRSRSCSDPIMAGNWKNDSFHLHSIKSDASPMLHFSRSGRPEIVLFGDDQRVADNFLHIESGLTVRSNGDSTVDIIRYLPSGKDRRSTCSNNIGDLIDTLADSGFKYGDLVKLFRKAKQDDMLESRLVVDAMPSPNREYIADLDGSDLNSETQVSTNLSSSETESVNLDGAADEFASDLANSDGKTARWARFKLFDKPTKTETKALQ